MSTSISPNIARLAGITLLVGLLVIALVAYALSVRPSMPSDGGVSRPVAAGSPVPDGTFRNGSYTATGNYRSPGGSQQIKVQLTLAGDVITAAEVRPGAIDNQSSQYQQQFIGGYRSQVVGRKINTVKLSRVSGSSLTSQGFNEALARIEAQAKS